VTSHDSAAITPAPPQAEPAIPPERPTYASRAVHVTLYEDRAEVRRHCDLNLQGGIEWIAVAGISPFVDDRSVQVRILPDPEPIPEPAPVDHPTGQDASKSEPAPQEAPESTAPTPDAATDEVLDLDRSDDREPSPATPLPAIDPAADGAEDDGADLPILPLEEPSPQPCQILTARVRRRALATAHFDPLELEEAHREAQRRLNAAHQALARLQARSQRVAHLADDWLQGLRRVPIAADDEDLDQWRSAFGQLDSARAVTLAQLEVALIERDQAEIEAQQASQRLAAQGPQPRYEAVIEIQIAANQPRPVAVELTYRTPCALWRPEHLAELQHSEDTSDAKLTLTTFATVWQRTGESWPQVQLTLSTARPGRSASPPAIEDDILASRRKSFEERQRIVIESRDQDIATTGPDDGQRATTQMPGVDDGGQVLEFTATHSIDLPSTGEALRVPIHTCHMPAKVSRVLRPERSQVAHIRALANLDSDKALLAGPINVVSNGAMVGRSKGAFVAPGDAFELGFGSDDAIRVRRRVHNYRGESAITGNRTLESTVDIFITNLSKRHITIELTERIPVSEIGALTVTLQEARGFQHDEKTGFLTARLSLDPNATQQHTIIFEIRSPAKSELPF